MKELLRKRELLKEQARKINAAADAESRLKTPEERAEFDRLTGELEALSSEIESRQRFDALNTAVATVGDGEGHATIDPSGDLPHQQSRNLGKYSILRALLLCAEGKAVDGLEGEVSQELIKRRGGRAPDGAKGFGFVMPNDLPVDLRSAAMGRVRFGGAEQRALGTAEGVGSIFTTPMLPLIDLLRNRMVTRQAGARVLTGMQGPFAIPRQSATGTVYWLAEGGAPTASSQTIDQVAFTPRTVGAFTDITRRFMAQTSIDAEMFVRDDLANIVALGVDLAALNGTGSGNQQPTGILQNSGIPTVAIGAAGGPPTWAAVVALETAVAVANADIGSLAYVTNAKVRGKAKVTLKDTASTGPIYLWDTMGGNPSPLNGYPVYVTNQLPSNLVKGASGAVCSPMIFGNWSDLIIAFWSGQDVIVDPYSLSTSGGLRIVVLQDCDMNVRHPESFAKIVDITTT